jgi:uncharacterized protein (TIGR03435 family)
VPIDAKSSAVPGTARIGHVAAAVRTALTPAGIVPRTARAVGNAVLEPIGALAGGDAATRRSGLVTHLWQSTLFALAVALVTLAFRRHDARVRYWLWLSASIKFLIPFALLVTLGGRLPWPSGMTTVTVPAASVQDSTRLAATPTSGSRVPNAPLPANRNGWLRTAALGIWLTGTVVILRIRVRMWQRIRRTLAASRPLHLTGLAPLPGVALRTAPSPLEPGVVGFWRPVVLLPGGIEHQLTPAQLEAVLAHEACHVRCMDNLTAALHMVTEAAFWFHPLVWWIGARLVDERERACDEAVLRELRQPRDYAEGLLAVCRRYVDARLACVAGVSGSDLKKRIEAIMTDRTREVLSVSRTVLLASAGAATIVLPILAGALTAPVVRVEAQTAAAAMSTFEAASVKENKSGRPGWDLEPQPGGRLTATNVTVSALVRFAYDRPDFQVSGGPDWLDSDRFDVAATAGRDQPVDETRRMLRQLLTDRFAMTAHAETRQLPIYALVMSRSDGRLGPQLRQSTANCDRVDQPSFDSGFRLPTDAAVRCGFFGFSADTNLPAGHGGFSFRGLTMDALAKTLMPVVQRSVVDRTGLTGYFDADFDFMAEIPPPPPPPGMPNPFSTPFVSVFTILPEQLGIKLDSQRGPVDVLVIDRAERPTVD